MPQLHQGNQSTITVNFLNAAGEPGTVEGSTVWTATPPELVDLFPSEDTKSVLVVWKGAGTVVVSSVSDGDLGTGPDQVFPVATSDSFECVAPLGATSATTTISPEEPAPV